MVTLGNSYFLLPVTKGNKLLFVTVTASRQNSPDPVTGRGTPPFRGVTRSYRGVARGRERRFFLVAKFFTDFDFRNFS